jgi:hypothetical protein
VILSDVAIALCIHSIITDGTDYAQKDMVCPVNTNVVDQDQLVR